MKLTLQLPAAPWPVLTGQIRSAVTQAQFAQAGVWQLRQLEVVLPNTMARPSAEHLRQLQTWLAAQAAGLRVVSKAAATQVELRLEFLANGRKISSPK